MVRATAHRRQMRSSCSTASSPRKRVLPSCVHLCLTTDPFMVGHPEIGAMSLAIIERLNRSGIECSVLTRAAAGRARGSPALPVRQHARHQPGVARRGVPREWEPGAALYVEENRRTAATPRRWPPDARPHRTVPDTGDLRAGPGRDPRRGELCRPRVLQRLELQPAREPGRHRRRVSTARSRGSCGASAHNTASTARSADGPCG